MSWLAEFVDDLSEFDRAMNKAVTDSGILKHVPRRALAKEGVHHAPHRVFRTVLRAALCLHSMLPNNCPADIKRSCEPRTGGAGEARGTITKCLTPLPCNCLSSVLQGGA